MNGSSVDKNKYSTASQTKGVETLLGNPKKAIIKLSIPMILAMSVHTIYNLVDAIWVSGLGADALASIGFIFPFFIMAMALATGLGVGSGSAISRRIGAGDKKGVDKVGVNTIIFMLLISVIVSVPLFTFAEIILSPMGSGRVLDMAVSYGRIIFGGTVIIFFVSVAVAILRAEGDVKRAMYVMIAGSILNIILDPIFIYTFNLGVAGAAWATVFSLSVTSAFLAYWLFLKKDTYIAFHFKGFRFDKYILKDILKVGLPSSIQQLSMSITMIVFNIVIVYVGGTDGVAVYTSGWRVATMAILPLFGISTAVVSVTGAAFGSQSYQKLNASFWYAIKIALLLEIVIAVLIFVFAPNITGVFTLAEGARQIAPDLEVFLKIMCLLFPGAALAVISSSLFQGTGKGVNALILTLLRTIILAPIFVVLFAVVFDMGLTGVWWGIVLANIISSTVAFFWSKNFIQKSKQLFNKGIILEKEGVNHGP